MKKTTKKITGFLLVMALLLSGIPDGTGMALRAYADEKAVETVAEEAPSEPDGKGADTSGENAPDKDAEEPEEQQAKDPAAGTDKPAENVSQDNKEDTSDGDAAAPEEETAAEESAVSEESEDPKEEEAPAADAAPGHENKDKEERGGTSGPAAGGSSVEEEASEDSPAENGEAGGSKEEEKEAGDAAVEGTEGEQAPGEEAGEDSAPEKGYPALSQRRTVNGVTVTVSADAGVFPEDAVLSVTAVQDPEAGSLVERELDEDRNIAVSYTFDIKILDADGNELQPADGQTVDVSFRTEEVADENLDTQVFHISDDGVVEELDVDTSGRTATVETEGFSIYSVIFIYNGLEYSMRSDTTVPLSDILQNLGLSGVVTDVQCSDTSLFSASQVSGAWMITSHRDFNSDEWMKVTVDSKVYTINVYVIIEWDYEVIDGVAHITGYRGDDKNVIVPANLGGCSSVAVSSGSFLSEVHTGTLTFEGNVASIGEEAFYGCDKLENVTFKGNVGSIGSTAYDNCENLISVTFEGNVDSISMGAFYSCNKLENVTFEGDVDSIGKNVFRYCQKLGNVAFEGDVNSIGDDAFNNCGNLTSVTIGSSKTGMNNVGSIGEDAFAGMPSGSTITVNTCKSKVETGNSGWSGDATVNWLWCEVKAAVDPESSGTVAMEASDGSKGTGSLVCKNGADVTCTAKPADGYAFDVWTERSTLIVDGDNNPVGPSYQFKATTDRTLTANFREIVIEGIKPGGYIYTGSPIVPEVTVSLKGVDIKLLNNTDYTVTLENNTDAGTETVKPTLTVTLNPPLEGSRTVTFEITPADISTAEVTVKDQQYQYNGTEQKPEPTVKWNGQTLVKDKDYTMSYTDNVHAGPATVTVTGKGNFDSKTSAQGTFTITKCPLTVTANTQTYTYNGEDQGPGDTTYDSGLDKVVAVTGLQGSDALTSVTIDGQAKEAGAYEGELVPQGAMINGANEDDSDYTITYVPGTLAIGPAKAEITVYSASKVKGAKDPAFTGTVKGLVDDGDLGKIRYVRTNSDEEPGTYKGVLTAEYTANKNYVVTVAKGDFTINEKPVKKGTLTFDLAGGTLDGKTGKVTIKADVGDEIEIPKAPTRSGYTFQYWKGSKYHPGDKYKVKGDHTFTAVWKKDKAKTYKVTFNANGHGEAPAAQTVEEGKKASKPVDPKASGYTFGGWFTDKACKKAFDFNTAIKKDTTLYAKWTKSSSGGGTSKKASGSSGAKTGDENHAGIWLMLMTAALLGLGLAIKRKKQSER